MASIPLGGLASPVVSAAQSWLVVHRARCAMGWCSRGVALTLRLFGAARITGTGGALATQLLAKPKALALLAYLAMASPRGFHLSRCPPRAPLARLGFRSRAQLVAPRPAHAASPPAGRGADVPWQRRGEDRLARPRRRRHDVRGLSPDDGRAADAMALYNGTLLDGFSLFANTGFDAWLSGERERLQARAVRAAMVLASRHELDPGDAPGAAEWCTLCARTVANDEDLLRYGDRAVRPGEATRATATQLYLRAVDRFRAGLGIAVSSATARLGQSLAQEQPVDTEPQAPTLAVSRAGRRSCGEPAAGRTGVGPRIVTSDTRRLCLERAAACRPAFAAHDPRVRSAGTSRHCTQAPTMPKHTQGWQARCARRSPTSRTPGRDEAWTRACAHATQVIRLDPLLGEAHAVLAHVALCQDYNWALAEELYCKALEVDPVSVICRTLLCARLSHREKANRRGAGSSRSRPRYDPRRPGHHCGGTR